MHGFLFSSYYNKFSIFFYWVGKSNLFPTTCVMDADRESNRVGTIKSFQDRKQLTRILGNSLKVFNTSITEFYNSDEFTAH